MRTAIEGEHFSITYRSMTGRVLKPQTREDGHVHPACSNKTNGQWVCLRHEVALTNFDKDSHISDHTGCVIGWRCFTHGIEQP